MCFPRLVFTIKRCSSGLLTQSMLQGVPLLANLSEKVIWDEINQHDTNALSVAANFSDTEIIDMSQHDKL